MKYHKWYRADKRLFDVALGAGNVVDERGETEQEARVRMQCESLLGDGKRFVEQRLNLLAPFEPVLEAGITGIVAQFRPTDLFAKRGPELLLIAHQENPAVFGGELRTWHQ